MGDFMKLFKKGHGMKVHILIGMGVLIVAWYLNTQFNWFELPTDNMVLLKLLIIGAIYSLMPDCDQPGSVINKYVTLALVGIIIWAFMYDQSEYGIAAAIIIGAYRWIEHRKCVHSIVAGLIVSAPLFYFGFLYFIVGFIAYMSHIVADGEVSFFMEKDWW